MMPWSSLTAALGVLLLFFGAWGYVLDFALRYLPPRIEPDAIHLSNMQDARIVLIVGAVLLTVAGIIHLVGGRQ